MKRDRAMEELFALILANTPLLTSADARQAQGSSGFGKDQELIHSG